MLHKKIRMPRSTAIQIMDELGKLDDAIEFIDLNKENLETSKNFSEIIGRCDEIEKKFIKLDKICQDHDVEIFKFDSYKKFIKELNEDESVRHKKSGSTYFDLLENEIIEDEKKIEELIESYENIKEGLTNLFEKRAVYAKSTQLFQSGQLIRSPTNVFDESRRMIEEGFVSDLNYIAGVSKADDEIRIKRMIFRISRGRAVSHFFNVPEEENINQVQKAKNTSLRKIFLIFFQSGIENVLLTKIIKICDLFGVSRYIIPRPDEMQYQLNMIRNDISEKVKFLREAENSIYNFLKLRAGEEGEPGHYDLYRKYFKKERLIFVNMNKCVLSDYLINGEVWMPADNYDLTKRTLEKYAENDPNLLAVTFEDVVTNKEVVPRTPPTFFKTNDLIYPFQEIVNTYGVPRYREINPALFTIVTFPFLFGVMFGDIGHGLLLFMFAWYLCREKDELVASKSSLAPFLKARYILLLMGFFACYSGFMYNDFLSIPLNIFGTCYENVQGEEIAVKKDRTCVYPFGIDPKWYVASNELAFFNSLKMKLSVILGVLQMIFGILLRGMNASYFKNTLDFVFEFIPQIIFMTTFFGYMIFMIFIKWTINWTYDPSQAPSIITLLMNIFLKKGSVEGKPLYVDTSFQETVHFWVLIICLICIPVILIPKPIIVYKRQEAKFDADADSYIELVEAHEKTHNKSHNNPHKNHHESFSDLVVHQSIETIEFVLGSISNTASYLRLWALSLAHAQLAKVFFDKSILGFVQEGNLLLVILGFFIFANVTFAVLMCMDLMECFLHTLRLHWVEFQNKFFKADGVKFQPFSFKYLIDTN